MARQKKYARPSTDSEDFMEDDSADFEENSEEDSAEESDDEGDNNDDEEDDDDNYDQLPTKSLSTNGRQLKRMLRGVVLVPYRWSRRLTDDPDDQGPLVYYCSPSGRILRNIGEVAIYLSQHNACRCYLLEDLRLEDSFNFDPAISGLHMPPPTSLRRRRPRCLQWHDEVAAGGWATSIRPRVERAIRRQVVAEMAAILVVLARTMPEATREVYRHKFDWHKVDVLRDGRIYLKAPLVDEYMWRHRLYEWKNSPLVAGLVRSSANGDEEDSTTSFTSALSVASSSSSSSSNSAAKKSEEKSAKEAKEKTVEEDEEEEEEWETPPERMEVETKDEEEEEPTTEKIVKVRRKLWDSEKDTMENNDDIATEEASSVAALEEKKKEEDNEDAETVISEVEPLVLRSGKLLASPQKASSPAKSPSKQSPSGSQPQPQPTSVGGGCSSPLTTTIEAAKTSEDDCDTNAAQPDHFDVDADVKEDEESGDPDLMTESSDNEAEAEDVESNFDALDSSYQRQITLPPLSRPQTRAVSNGLGSEVKVAGSANQNEPKQPQQQKLRRSSSPEQNQHPRHSWPKRKKRKRVVLATINDPAFDLLLRGKEEDRKDSSFCSNSSGGEGRGGKPKRMTMTSLKASSTSIITRSTSKPKRSLRSMRQDDRQSESSEESLLPPRKRLPSSSPIAQSQSLRRSAQNNGDTSKVVEIIDISSADEEEEDQKFSTSSSSSSTTASTTANSVSVSASAGSATKQQQKKKKRKPRRRIVLK